VVEPPGHPAQQHGSDGTIPARAAHEQIQILGELDQRVAGIADERVDLNLAVVAENLRDRLARAHLGLDGARRRRGRSRVNRAAAAAKRIGAWSEC
jgi:hypothetical protein